ncbi:MAG: ChaN family lipoprotein [Mucilaginibacter sp.]|nr:ChaN family lipoprotein [Mucilaginibacter sp.]
MKSVILSLLLILPLLALSQDAQNQHYKIYNTVLQKQVSVDDVIATMDNADILFFGEEHTDSIGHVVEYSLLKKLSDKYPGKVAFSMEMFETDCQPVLNEYLKGAIREKDLVKDGRAWPNYKDYRPMVEFSKSNNLPVIAANAPSRYVHMVTDKGLANLQQLDRTAQQYLAPLPIDTASGVYYDKFLKIMGGHGAMGNLKIYQSQNLWDATMGWSIAQFYKKHRDFKILQINGSFHSEEKLGSVAQLKKYAPKARVLNIATYNDGDFNEADWAKYKQLGDYIIFTKSK